MWPCRSVVCRIEMQSRRSRTSFYLAQRTSENCVDIGKWCKYWYHYTVSMAYVVRHASGRSPFWYAVFRDETGNRRKRSTKLTSKSKALEMARGLEKAAAEARRQALT